MLILKSQTIETIAKTVGLKPISVRKIKNILQNESGEQKPQSERKHHQSQIRLPTNTKLQSLLPLWDQEQGNHRIIGTIMGISKQRVGQLVLEHRKDGVSLFDYPRQRKLDQIQVTRKDALQKLLKIQAY